MPLLCGIALPITFFIALVQTLGDLVKPDDSAATEALA
jgi:lipopolysaccharide export LptBFGC system permease protein LptF